MSAFREALSDLPDPVFADFLESDDAYLLVVDLPGVTDDAIDVEIEGGKLHIGARRDKPAPEGFQYRREDRPIFVDPVIPLPRDAGQEIETEIEQGVLEITIPKGEGDETIIDIEDA